MFLLLTTAATLAAPSARAVHASSGDAALALDADPSTGWVPVGDPVGERWVLELEAPTALTRLQLGACPGETSFEVAVWFDGLGAGRSVRVDPGLPRYVLHTADRDVQRVELRVVGAGGPVCLAEVQAAGPEGPLNLATPDEVRGRLAASSVQDPAFAWGPRRAFDGRLDTAFESSESQAGETLWLTLAEPLDLVGVELWVGDQRDPGPQFPAGVPDSVSISVDGDPPREHPLDGSGGPQLLPVSGLGSRLTLEFGVGLGASPGRGTAVAEVRLWTPSGPVRVVLPDAGVPGSAPVADRVLHPVCGPAPSLPSQLRLRPDGTVTLAWEGQDGGGTWWHVLDGTWAQPVVEGPTWSARVDGTLRTWRTAASAGPVAPGPGPSLGGTLQIISVDELGDGLVAVGQAADGCPDDPTGPGERIVIWNDAAQRMR